MSTGLSHRDVLSHKTVHGRAVRPLGSVCVEGVTVVIVRSGDRERSNVTLVGRINTIEVSFKRTNLSLCGP